jgi:LysM repeat protein
MERKTSALPRIVAALALAAAVVAIIVVISSSSVSNSSKSGGSAQHAKQQQQHQQPRTQAKTYTVQTGDTLISIAHKTGVPVAELRALNPEVDPQILIAGQTLQLR